MYINGFQYQQCCSKHDSAETVNEGSWLYFNDLYRHYDKPFEIDHQDTVISLEALLDDLLDQLNRDGKLSTLDYFFMGCSGLMMNARRVSLGQYYKSKYHLHCHLFDSRNAGILSTIQSLIFLNSLTAQFANINAIMVDVHHHTISSNKNNIFLKPLGNVAYAEVSFLGNALSSHEILHCDISESVFIHQIIQKCMNQFDIPNNKLVIYASKFITHRTFSENFKVCDLEYPLQLGFFYYCLAMIDKTNLYYFIIDEDVDSHLLGCVLIKPLM